MNTHIIFDLDGTLIDSSPSILSAFSAALSSHNIEPVVRLDSSLIGPPLRDTLSKLTGSNDLVLLDAMSDTFKGYYDNEGYKSTEVFPGVHEVLSELAHRNIPFYVATNKRLHPTRLIMKHLGWAEYFRGVYTLDCMTPNLLNKATMLTYLLADVGISSLQAFYVGDKLEDGLAADANSLPFLAACWGYGALAGTAVRQHWRLLHLPEDLIDSLL
jgi:phosphoglycolate phosphatase